MKKIKSRKEVKNYLKRFIVLIPLVIVVLVMTYFIHLFNYYENKYYEKTIADVQFTLSTIVSSVDNVGLDAKEYQNVYDNMIRPNILGLDRLTGVSVRIYDLDVNFLYSPQQESEDVSTYDILQKDSPEYKIITKQIRESNKGSYAYINSDGEEETMIWQIMPSPPYQKVYIILTVNKSTIVKSIESIELEAGMFILCSITIIAVYDSVWIRVKNYNKCDTEK